MKKLGLILSILFVLFIPVTIMADSIEDNEVYYENGFVAPSMTFTKLNDEFGTMLGLRAGWITEKSFTVEGCFYGLINEVDSPRQGSNIGMGYSGLSLEYTILPDSKIHVLLNAMMGVGRVSYKRDYSEPKNTEKDKLSSVIAIIEPGAGLEFCITKNIRAVLGLSYRYVERVDLKNLEDDDIRGISGNLAIRFGSFD